MKKPDDLVELLETLKDEDAHTSVQVGENPRAVVCIDEKRLVLGGKDCKFLFNTVETAEQFIEAMGNTVEMNLELEDLELDPDVISVLESSFSTVDEL